MTWDSFMKLSTESEACIRLSVIPSPKSPRMVPGSASKAFVEPIIVLTTLTALLPFNTHATIGPDVMNSTNSGKKGFSWWEL